MACPFFDPRTPRSSASDPRFAMMPLGDSWSGACLAGAAGPVAPDEYSLHHVCNFGYARGRCPYFAPADTGDAPDAVRFSLAADGGGTLSVRWCAERDHRPAGHGSLHFDRSTRAPVAGAAAPPEVFRLAAAYVEAYLRRSNLEQ